MKKNMRADRVDRSGKVVSIPLLFKNCEIEVATPHRSNIVEPRTTRGGSANNKSLRKLDSHSKDHISRKDSRKVIKIDLKKNNAKPVVKAVLSSCRSQAQLKPVCSSSKENESASINTDRTSLTTATDHTERQSNKPFLKTQQLIKSSNGSVREFNDLNQVSIELSAVAPSPASELHELRERFIKKRSEVYQVLCNLDNKFDRMKRKDGILGQIEAGSKQQIVNLIREKTSPRNPSLFNKSLSRPNFVTIKKDSVASIKRL